MKKRFLAPEQVLIAESRHNAEPSVEEAVTVGESAYYVGAGTAPAHTEVFHSKIIGGYRVVLIVKLGAAHPLVRRELLYRPVVERLEVAFEEEGAVAGGEIGCYLHLLGSVLHHEVDRTADTVTFHIGGKRLGYLYTVQHLGGEDIQGNEAVLVVRAGDLHSVDQSVVVAFVHAATHYINNIN